MDVKIVKGHAREDGFFFHLRDKESGKLLMNKSGKCRLEFRNRSAAERFVQKMKETSQ